MHNLFVRPLRTMYTLAIECNSSQISFLHTGYLMLSLCAKLFEGDLPDMHQTLFIYISHPFEEIPIYPIKDNRSDKIALAPFKYKPGIKQLL